MWYRYTIYSKIATALEFYCANIGTLVLITWFNYWVVNIHVYESYRSLMWPVTHLVGYKSHNWWHQSYHTDDITYPECWLLKLYWLIMWLTKICNALNELYLCYWTSIRSWTLSFYNLTWSLNWIMFKLYLL